jgi:hypothetical protein
MGVFDLSFVQEHLSLADYPTCVETGTGLGYSTCIVQSSFEKVYTIELDEALWQNARDAFSGHPNVTCIQGESSERLAQILPDINTPAIFFLDAHWSGDERVDWTASSWQGYGRPTTHRRGSLGDQASELATQMPSSREQNPLLEEIDRILRFPLACAIYIDDLDKFESDGKGKVDKGFKGEDWSHLDWNEIVELCKPRLEAEHYKGGDQALLLLKALH